MGTGRFSMRTGMATQLAKTSESKRVPENKEIPELHERIAMRAYQIYEDNGYAKGRDLDNWLQAEQEVLEDQMEADFQ
jgi:hypothetical protein